VNWDPLIGYMSFLPKRITSAVKKDEFVGDRMSYIILRGHWFHIIVLKVNASADDRSHYVKDSFYKELKYLLKFSET
jgi:hypothetical protein